MSTFNHFGLQYSDIVSAFKGSIATDFGGQSVIEAEMDLVEGEILNKLSQQAIRMMEIVEYMEIQPISGATWTAVPPIMSDLYIWQVPRFNPAINNQQYSLSSAGLGLCNSGTCPSQKKELDTGYLFNDYTLNGDEVTFGSSFDQDNYTYYASYNVDTTRIRLPSLAIILRNRVACILGNQLYTRGVDSWKLVDVYCARGDSGLAAIDEYFIPSEYKKSSFLNNPFKVKGGYTTIKTYRG